MNACQSRIRLILALIIGYKIQRIYGLEESFDTSSSSDDDEPLFSKMLSTLPQILGTLTSAETRQMFMNSMPKNLTGTSDLASGSLSQLLGTLTTDQTGQAFMNSFSKNFTASSDRAANDRVLWWNSLNTAIDDFKRKFEQQHEASIIRVDRRLKTTEWPIMSDDGFTRRYRIDFSYRTSEQDEIHSSVIISIPDLGSLHEKGKELMLYDKEKYMFEKVLPQMYPSRQNEKHSPNFYSSTEVGQMLIVQNLNDGLRNVKNEQLDPVDECKLIFKALAQFHALSVSQLDEIVYSNLDALTPVRAWVNNAVTGYFGMEMMTQSSKRLAKLLPESMRDEITSMTRNLESVVESIYSGGRGADKFVVVLQGIPTRNNVFCVHDKQTSRISGCKFFDFRVSHVGSPVLDLMAYFLNTPFEFEVYEASGNSLFEFYLEELHKNLKTLNHSREYDLTMLRADLKRYKAYFIYSLINVVPLQWEIDQQMSLKMDHLMKNRSEVLKSSSYISFFKKWMNVFTSW